ncbi:MAG: ornithine carbamoyltransferase [Candidatus Fimivivens sp.]
MKHLLKLLDLSTDEIIGLLDLADNLKYEKNHNIAHPILSGQTLGMIFQKSSTRTRVSFEVGMYQLGGHALFLSARDLQIGRGEPIADTARVLSRYLNGIVIRTFEQQEVEALAKHGSIPIINALTDFAHPCQVLADLQTIRAYHKTLQGKKLCFIGDGNNMANSLIVGCLKTGMKISVVTPKGYAPDPKIMAFAKAYPDFEWTQDPMQGAADADVLYTDVWASMGQESEQKIREKDFEGFQIDKTIMSVAHANAMVLHCLPAHRGEEIAPDIFEEHANEIFDEAENRLHIQKAILVTLMKNNQ